MDDPAFELRLGKLFAEHPQMADAQAFAGAIEQRLGRGWALRSVMIVFAGVVGGAITLVQMMGSGLAGRIESASHLMATARQGLIHLPAPFGSQLNSLSDLPYGGEVMWLVLGLAALAAALLAGRTLEDM